MKRADYVDNKELLLAIKEWQEKRKQDPTIPLNDTIGNAIIAISKNLSKRWNFSGYTDDWKEQMIGDGIEYAVRYIKNFDADRYDNPHAYITTICFRAFQGRIKKERKESVCKYKYFVEEVFDFVDDELASHVGEEFYQDMVNKIVEYDESMKKIDKIDPCHDDELPSYGLGKIYGKDF